ncbi:MAG: aminotransferase class V-fold PLP-dependent enzyme [Bacteroidetes bacterium]|jgi:selenocysteine lyase/cysteine desulfurase|nr:aminotransferase class V-fold PLP-dependent enzyme [Bacteroidota bacterium]MBT4397974.1 aminotransferase class V-fold PLP-dependent enzyme [Bacteroidota bacterium]MBT4411494.1 aminotransferase class V-fold PLP-dependent enzyme [Bacteroidota bacterium]MBT7094690.1 aminotransferase class V-fold PLP-dependent enzyme [Bacteroidota bacterium]MBT7465930.1 aminotransferase class V-fold PLP-dependent enzyme [Bacteroidota bacterium]
MDKRTFLKKLGLLSLAAAPSAYGIDKWVDIHSDIPASKLASNEDFWAGIRQGYRLKPDYINLENGFYCIQPTEVLEKHIRHIREVNYQGSYYMRTVQLENRRKVIKKLADLTGCSTEELALTRNTTESLDMIIGGFPWKAGDEAIMAEQDYGAMLNMFDQVAEQYGVVNKRIMVPNHPKSDEEIVKIYEDAITDKTRMIMVCHMINITGHILPVRKICDMAHKYDVQVLVDGAHAVAHFHFKIEDLNCDYYGASLHKWLSVPLGSGMLYVRKKRIKDIQPFMAEGKRNKDDITRLAHIGTKPVHTDLTIPDAIDYYNMIGPARKEERLRYLQTYWTSKVRDLPNVIVNTSADPQRACGIANVGIKGMNPSDLSKLLMDKYKVYQVAINRPGVVGCRITPNVYTTLDELDTFVAALKEIAK